MERASTHMNHDETSPPPPTCAGFRPPVTFDQARAIAGGSREVLRWFDPGGIDVAPWGWENSADYILTARQSGEPWWHDAPLREIPGPPMIVVSKATGQVRTFIGAGVPQYYRERVTDTEETPIGDVPE
jgi:hypothetical protein